MIQTSTNSHLLPPWAPDLAKLPDIDFCWQEPLARHTTFRIGGLITCLAQPRSEPALLTLLQTIHSQNIRHFILGSGSNLLAPDDPWDAVAIKLDRCCSKIYIGSKDELYRQLKDTNAESILGQLPDQPVAQPQTLLYAGSGIRLARLLRICLQNHLSGLEFLVGIPSTLGGAVAMNAGSGTEAVGDCLLWVKTATNDGEIAYLPKSALQLGYRSAELPQASLVLGALLQMQPGTPDASKQAMLQTMQQRMQTQPLTWPSAGCIFKNPPTQAAGVLIERAGLKNLRIGDAQVSHQHANWIINLGQAKAQDVVTLMAIIEDRVYQQFGVQLDREIRILGP